MCYKLYANCKQVRFNQFTASLCIPNNGVQMNTSETILKLHEFELVIYVIFSPRALYYTAILFLVRVNSNVTGKEPIYFRIDIH